MNTIRWTLLIPRGEIQTVSTEKNRLWVQSDILKEDAATFKKALKISLQDHDIKLIIETCSM